jgi:hypothetical protein
VGSKTIIGVFGLGELHMLSKRRVGLVAIGLMVAGTLVAQSFTLPWERKPAFR